MSKNSSHDAAERKFFSPAEFAVLSGVSEATVRRYVTNGRLPSVQPGGLRHRVLIPADALAVFLRPAAERSAARESESQQQPTLSPPSPAMRPSAGPKPRWLNIE